MKIFWENMKQSYSRVPGLNPAFRWGSCCSSFRFSVLSFCLLCFVLVVCIVFNNICLSELLILDSTSVFSNDLLHYVSWNLCCIFIFITTLNNTKSPQMVDIEGVIGNPQWCLIIWVSEWLFVNDSSAIFQLYHGENKLILNVMMMRF